MHSPSLKPGANELVVAVFDGAIRIETHRGRALALPNVERRRVYEHFNRHETVGTVVAEAISAAGR